MIVVTERFFVEEARWAASEEQCRGLAQAMAGRRGCFHHCLVRARDGSASHVLYSIWESLEAFRAWTRSETFVLAANGAGTASGLPPRQAEVQLLPASIVGGSAGRVGPRAAAQGG
jgi:heme-degrading monooxygenase HmoA